MNCSAAHMKHLYNTRKRKAQKRSRTVKTLIKFNIGLNIFNAFMFFTMPAATPWVFTNPNHAAIAGESRDSQAPADTTAAREADGNPTAVKEVSERTIEAEIFEAFQGEDRITAAAIAYAESHLNPKKPSESDLMADGRPFSVGLFQINMTWHTLAGTDCSKAFKGKDYAAVVIDETLYAKCVELAQDPLISIDTAKGIYQRSGNSFYQWSTFAKGHHVQFISMFNQSM